MLELSEIIKNYELKDQTVTALKGVSICFRRSEFVSILGQSGCGKTTLLNIIGGLDKYTSGDLIIDGVSTKNFRDKDWDNYRNHRVGFVFQSYNLIPHQTVLENVELALTLSGIKKAERRKRAKEVLEKVGLGDKLKSRPNQLSGGQMQRVAIARALVNDPEIILADEPTGALDSKTSLQIMDLLKEVSKDKLVIMVTHNPDLAEKYSSRIVRLLDGELIEDSKPYSKETANKEIEKHKQKLEKEKAKEDKQGFKKTEKKKNMSIFTAMFLSLKNLLTKKGRTVLVALAGSIGIMGIALILAVSAGMTNYIDTMQSESLSSYPISVLYMALNTDSVMEALSGGGNENKKADDNVIEVYDPTEQLMDLGKYNYLSKDFVDYVENYYQNNQKRDLINDYQITYSSNMRLIRYNPNYAYTAETTEEGLPSIVENPARAYVPINSSMSASAINGTINSTFFKEMNKDFVLSMYNLKGKYPEKEDEVALVLNGNKTSIYTLYNLGLENDVTKKDVAVNDIIGQEFRLLYNDTYFNENCLPHIDFNLLNSTESSSSAEFYAAYDKKIEDKYVGEYLYSGEGLNLKITGILRLRDDAAGTIFSDGVMYTNALDKLYRENCKNSTTVKNLLGNYGYFDNGKFVFDETKKLAAFPIKYEANIEELNSYFKQYATLFTYATPENMKQTLNNDKFKIDLTYEEVMEIYLQVYNASDIPLDIAFYASNFDAKDDIISMIKTYNKTARFQLIYADNGQMVTNMLKSLVNIISYVLVAFAAISLVVSSIMIAIITYTSVIERTKEIGVLRSVGASKRDVSRVFNAETLIIGFLAGVFGIGISALLTIPINLILKALTGIGSLAIMQPLSCLILIAISIVLTVLAGLIPARIASKKDPVLALRTE